MKTLVVGAAVIDMIMVIDKLPKSGEDALCSENKITVGGCAYNAASTMKNLGCDHDLCVPVGVGMYANIIRKKLEEKGYPVLIEDRTKDNGYCLCLVEADGERTFITAQGVEGDSKMEWFQNIDMSQYDNVYIAGYQACGHSGEVLATWLGSEEVREKNIFFAPGPVICDIEKSVMDSILRLKPIVHLNDKELCDFTGEKTLEGGLKKLNAITDNLVIVTTGADGAMYCQGDNINTVASEPVEVVDTIGAGDSHIGGVMSGLSMGMSVEQSVALGNLVAANIVKVQGPVMDKEEFDRKVGEVSWRE